VQGGLESLVTPDAALVGAILVAASAAFAPITIVLVRRLYPWRQVVFARWGFSHVALVAVLFVGAQILGASLLAPAGAGPLAGLALNALAFAFAGVFVCALARKRDPDGVRSLGFWRGRNLRAVGVGWVAYGLSWPGLMGLMFAWPWLVERYGGGFEPQQLADLFRGFAGAELAAAVALGTLVQPFLEELLFRGFLQPLLVQNFREIGGIALTSALFAAMHGLDHFLPIFGLSMVLGAVMLRTQRLSAAFAIHALHNASQIALLLFLPFPAPAPGFVR